MMAFDVRNDQTRRSTRSSSGPFARWFARTSPLAEGADAMEVTQVDYAPAVSSELTIPQAPAPRSSFEVPRDLGLPSALSIPRYQELRVIDRGSADEVVLAADSLVGLPCAVRVVGAPRALDSAFRARLFGDIAAARTLAHPHIARIYEVQAEPERLCIFMQTFPGTMLEDLLRADAALVPARMLAIAKRLVRLLVVVHRHGLVHGAVSPSSVVVGHDDAVSLVDLGTSAARPPSELGEHAAPEVRVGALPTTSADIYAVGAMLARWSRQSVRDAPFIELLMRACHPSPAERFHGDASQLLAALECMPLPAPVRSSAPPDATPLEGEAAFRWTSLVNDDGTLRNR
jgi:serine/threonine protein kinase